MLTFFTVFKDILTYIPFAIAAEPAEYTPLQALPGIGDGGGTVSGVEYLPALFTLLVGATTVLAVVWLVLGGIQYMSTDAYSDKSQGKEKIRNALLGLLLAGASWLILNTINPQLIEIELSPVKNSTSVGSEGVNSGKWTTVVSVSELVNKYNSDTDSYEFVLEIRNVSVVENTEEACVARVESLNGVTALGCRQRP